MSANLRVAYVTCNTTLVNTAVDTVSGVTVTDTRIRGVHAQGVGEFIITGTSVDPFGNPNGGIIKFTNTTNSDVTEAYLTDSGVRMGGPVVVQCPTTASTVTIYYG
jgi:hypothetical protein